MKNATRHKRCRTNRRSNRKVVDTPEVPLPQTWKNCFALLQNNEDLAAFLISELITRVETIPENCELVTAGGYSDLACIMSTTDRDMSLLGANHEEADNKLILHAVDESMQ